MSRVRILHGPLRRCYLESDYTQGVAASGVYRTRGGIIFRVTDTVQAGLKIEVLKNGAWVPGRIGMVGLRLDRSTTQLDPKAILELPL